MMPDWNRLLVRPIGVYFDVRGVDGRYFGLDRTGKSSNWPRFSRHYYHSGLEINPADEDAFVASRTSRIVLRELHTLFNLGAIGDLTDGQLLERFATHDREAAELAFAALVERHGPMVLRVCRSILPDRHDADDAFQTTFLVLVKKARSLWVKDSLGPWLHRVARRSATKVRHSKARRSNHERRYARANPLSARDSSSPDDIAAVLHGEIDRLSDRHRIPIVICDLEGFTHEKAARQLGWPVGTVKSRLARAREILRGRLSRRGLGPQAGVLVAGKGANEALRAGEFVLPPALAESTIRAANAVAAGKAVETISAPVAILIVEGLKTMFWNKLRLASIALLFFGAAAAATVGVLAQSGARSSREAQLETVPRLPAAAPADRQSPLTRAPEPQSAPAYITQSRAMIVTRLEEELALARARLDRTLGKVRSPDDPAAVHARNIVDALSGVLARIDAVLVDAVDAYPTMFDFSGGPAAVGSKDEANSPPPGLMDVSSGARGMMGSGNSVRDGATRRGIDARSENRRRKAGASQASSERQQQQPGQNQAQPQNLQQQSGENQAQPQNLQQQPGQNQAQTQSQQQQSGQNQAQPQNQQQQSGPKQKQPQSQQQQSGPKQKQPQSQPQQPAHKPGQAQSQQKQAGQSQAQPQSQQQQGQSPGEPANQLPQDGQNRPESEES
jgi:RNA polymerase sigma factor (sigma-70 family)